MKRQRRMSLFVVLTILSISLFGQEDKSKDFTYSFSYIPPYLFLSYGEVGFLPVYTNLEANIHYKPFDRVSFSSGLGYFRVTEDLPDEYVEYYNEHGQSHVPAWSNLRVPLQANYHLVKSPQKTDFYIKAAYTNGIFFQKLVKYETDGTTNTSRNTSYIPSIGLGVGAVFLKHKTVGILLEGTIEKYSSVSDFSGSTFFILKIGVVI